MRLTTRSRFALIAITDVAVRSTKGPVTLASICERHGISLSYLEALFSALRRAGLVVSTRGPGGGYSLARNARDITVADVAQASEQRKAGPLKGDPDALNAHQGAMTHALWSAFNQTLVEHLRSVSLADLVAQHLATHGVPEDKQPPKPAKKMHAFQRQPHAPLKGVPNSVFALGTTTRSR